MSRENERRNILKKLRKSKSIYGMVAEFTLGISHLEEDYIIECYEQAHIQSFQRILKEELFNDLIKYNVQYNNKQKINFTNSTLTKQKTK